MLGRFGALRRVAVPALAALTALSGAVPQAVAGEVLPGRANTPTELPTVATMAELASKPETVELVFPEAPAREPPPAEITDLRTATSRTVRDGRRRDGDRVLQ